MKNFPIEKSQHKLKLTDIELSCPRADADPGLCLPYLRHQIRAKRWFVEKNTNIEGITIEDTFRLAADSNQIAEGIIARFELKGIRNRNLIKYYFIPVVISSTTVSGIPEDDNFVLKLSDGKRYISFAEHSLIFQKALIHHYRKSGIIRTSRGGNVCFHPAGSALTGIDDTRLTVRPLPMKYPSSNVLTMTGTDRQAMVSKTYKDMRGIFVQKGKMWLPNPEVRRYEALVAGGYSNIPELYGVAYYQHPNGKQFPIHIMMEAVSAEGQVGEVFARTLSQLLSELKTIKPGEYLQKFKQQIKGICFFADEVARTISHMHTAFLNSGRPGFSAELASSDDISRWSGKILNDFDQAMTTLRCGNREQCHENTLSELTNKLDHPDADFKKRVTDRVRQFEGIMMKAQVHGDLHGDQGLIRSWFGDSGKIEEFLSSIQRGSDMETRHQASQLAEMIKWVDFEGPPAKDYVSNAYDSRENLLTDLAGMIQGFWYMVNATLYDHLGLDHENSEDHERQRKASLVLAGQYAADEADIPGLNEEFIIILNLWHRYVTTSFIKGYLDETEKQNAQNFVLKKWDRDSANRLIYYWVMARSVHELRYETYGRNWGWEAIPGGRIIQITRNLKLET
ncbi:hypothetical protein [Desulfonema magnum]|uniref:Uncharacterized protein n=1 Tax=Desulfonema magnum TaxID=45655 RepID=A0A975BNF5_9BACT|nr:hypothetical protein [Desulfonema magnum]QTA88472.1 Uncharacterized protein dnm_045180 [Desulfonema magnum]